MCGGVMLVQLNVSIPWDLEGRLSEASHDYGISKRQVVLRGMEFSLLELEEPYQDGVRPQPIAKLPASAITRC